MTKLSIEADKFKINGRYTYSGRVFEGKPVGGLLFNVRAVQAIFDDENPDTRQCWLYPDMNEWDPDRITEEFITALPAWKNQGILAFTVNLQGGMPIVQTELSQPWINSTFRSDGSLKPAYLSRTREVLVAADELGMAVIIGLYYFGQDEQLEDEKAVIVGVKNAVGWLLETKYENIIVEINNECDVPAYEHEILKPGRVHELIRHAKNLTTEGRRLLVSTSFSGGKLPTEEVLEEADLILVHGNHQMPDSIKQLVKKIRRTGVYRNQPKPIVFNEDGTDTRNLDAAFEVYTSWGYYDQGKNNYKDGFQSPPVNWEINTKAKQKFFSRVAEITGQTNRRNLKSHQS